VFFKNIHHDKDIGRFHFDYLIAITCFSGFLRLIFMLQLTQTFGPTINIIIEMAKDMGVFFLLFFLQIFAFAILGMLVFSKMEQF
jgi:hypothetical protein